MKRTIGYFPTLEGKPARWCEGSGQICYADSTGHFAVVLSPSRDAVMKQIKASAKMRIECGFQENEISRYGIQRVEALR